MTNSFLVFKFLFVNLNCNAILMRIQLPINQRSPKIARKRRLHLCALLHRAKST